jgi:oligopeptide transport system substrate-binding protein
MSVRGNVRRDALAICVRWLVALVFMSLACTGHAKTLRFSFLIAETEFDPVKVTDLYSNTINDAIFEPLLTYDYLARPVKLKPNVATAMPEISPDGTTYTFKIKPGIFFADDAAFGGKKRELTSQDFAYTLRRLYDPVNRSGWLWYVEGKIVGADVVMAAAKKSGKYDYDAAIEGIETPDRYTLRIRLKAADSNFLYIFATCQTAAMAREVVERYGADIGAHPVGTGPFKLATWKRSHKIVLDANPNFREVVYDAEPAADDQRGQAILKAMKGKKLPLVDRVEVSVIEESQPRWLAFLGGDTDYANVPNEFVGLAFPGASVAPYLQKMDIAGERFVETDLAYTYFNLDHPVTGGVSPERVALRRAIAMGYNYDQEIAIIRNGGAVRAESAVPPGVEGYDAAFRAPFGGHNPVRARALLETYGYVDRDGDGYRETPDGKPLAIVMGNEPDTLSGQYAALWKKSMDAIGINIQFKRAKWPDLNKEAKAGKLQMWFLAWSADYPDAENFFQNLYGPNVEEGTNYARFRHARFDQLYEQARKLQPGPERNKLYAEMKKIVSVYVPWITHVHRIRNELWHPWLIGYRKHPIYNQMWMYLDIDESKRPERAAGAQQVAGPSKP